MTRLASLSIDLDSLKHYGRIHGLSPNFVRGAGRPPDPRDLDSLKHYGRIHGLSPNDPEGADPVYALAAERFGELCARLAIHGTVFCIGEELRAPEAARAVAVLARAGHEVGNHTQSHDYALTRRTAEGIAAEVRDGAEAIARVIGRPPSGFRAPGYLLSAPLLAALAEQGYRYDSSALPAPPYWAAKAAVLGAKALAGRPSAAILDWPRALLAPRQPYRPSPSDPYRRGGADALPLLEIPITTGLAGLPVIGTLVAALPPPLAAVLCAGTGSAPHFNLELHGVDLLDASDLPPAWRVLARRQPGLGIPAARKASRVEALVRRQARDWVPLETAADRLNG
jgi:hypothetical protein